jgi:hypothetical protein
LAVAVPHSFKQLWHTALRQRIRVLLLLQQLRCIVGVSFLCAAQRGVAFGVCLQAAGLPQKQASASQWAFAPTRNAVLLWRFLVETPKIAQRQSSFTRRLHFLRILLLLPIV